MVNIKEGRGKRILEMCVEPRSCRYIASELHISMNAVQKWLARLRSDGYVVKIRDFGDPTGNGARYKTTGKHIPHTGFTICGVKF
jgi:predicted ArsR family transcriptional regulator